MLAGATPPASSPSQADDPAHELVGLLRRVAAEGWRLAAREIEEAVIRILADALTSPARLVERFGAAGMPSEQTDAVIAHVGEIGQP
jgi:hypothetical protein